MSSFDEQWQEVQRTIAATMKAGLVSERMKAACQVASEVACAHIRGLGRLLTEAEMRECTRLSVVLVDEAMSVIAEMMSPPPFSPEPGETLTADQIERLYHESQEKKNS